MHRTTCVVCHGALMKRVYRRDPELASDQFQIPWTSSKDLEAIDSLHHADQREWVGDVWCPECGLKYMTE